MSKSLKKEDNSDQYCKAFFQGKITNTTAIIIIIKNHSREVYTNDRAWRRAYQVDASSVPARMMFFMMVMVMVMVMVIVEIAAHMRLLCLPERC